MLSELKNFAARQMDLEELVSLSAKARSLEKEFESLAVEQPTWVTVKVAELRREITARNADSLAERLLNLKTRRAALATPDEKRNSLDAEIAKLQERLGGPQTPATTAP